MLAYVSAIQDISLSPVLISGAGTSMPGPNTGNRNGCIYLKYQCTVNAMGKNLCDNTLITHNSNCAVTAVLQENLHCVVRKHCGQRKVGSVTSSLNTCNMNSLYSLSGYRLNLLVM